MSDATVFSPAPAPPPNRLGPGTRLSDIYEIDEMIGQGGMGAVFKGHAIETGDTVAIKTIRPEMAENAAALALFRKEAQALHNLYHQAIVRYFVFTVDRTLGVPYLAMEYVSGEPLTDKIARGPVPAEELRILQCRLADGLGAAHDLGIVHRDVSPDNIILPGGDVGRAKIIDFGIARSKLGDSTVIGDGFAGKYGYVSPEQLGLYGGDVTGQSDIYSLGLVLVEAALGRRLDMGSTHVDVIEKRRAVPDLSGVDGRLKPLYHQMLQPDPKNRPASMAEIARCPPFAAEELRESPAGKRGGRTALFAGVGALTLAAAGAAVVFGPNLLGGQRNGDRPAATAPATSPTPSGGTGQDATPSGRNAPASDLSEPTPAPTPTPSPVPTQSPAPTPSPTTPSQTTPSPAPTPAPTPAAPPAVTEPTPAPSTGPSVMERITDFIRGYTGGSCFFVTPTTVGSREAVIEGLGVDTAPFVKLDEAFKREFGFEADIRLRQITREQCPIVDLMATRIGRGARVPKLTLTPDVVRAGDEIAVSADLWPEAQGELLLVGDDGVVQNITRLARRTGDTMAVRLKVDGTVARGQSKPQLLVAVASSRPLGSLRGSGPVSAERLVRDVAAEIARPGSDASFALQYFKLTP